LIKLLLQQQGIVAMHGKKQLGWLMSLCFAMQNSCSQLHHSLGSCSATLACIPEGPSSIRYAQLHQFATSATQCIGSCRRLLLTLLAIIISAAHTDYTVLCCCCPQDYDIRGRADDWDALDTCCKDAREAGISDSDCASPLPPRPAEEEKAKANPNNESTVNDDYVSASSCCLGWLQ
jgi:hypothetical protein